MHFDWNRETESSGHIVFYCEPLKDIVNSFYILEGNLATLDRKILDSASAENKLCYLIGAYMRFGEKPKCNEFRMANGYTKLITIGRVLSALGCENVRYYYTADEGRVPNVGKLYFQPCDTVRDRLGIEVIDEPPSSTSWKYEIVEF
jgi:hypothetical protein